jgi:hypothetical protein
VNDPQFAESAGKDELDADESSLISFARSILHQANFKNEIK